MDDDYKDLAAIAKRIKTKQNSFLEEALKVQDKLNDAFDGLTNVGGMSVLVTFEDNANDDVIYGYLFYRDSELGIMYRYSEQDFDDMNNGVPLGRPETREYHSMPLADCKEVWLQRAMDKSVIASLMQNIRAGLAETEQQYDRLLSNLQNLPMFEATDLDALPAGPRRDLEKAAERFRADDLSGAITAACGAVDTAFTDILGDRSEKPSFQEGVNLAVKQVLTVQADLEAIGWDGKDAKLLAANFKSALSGGAFVMQTLRSKMGDTHGTKPILVPLTFDALKWAEIMVRTLTAPTR
ncbi:hypothetical protein [Burkholderia glumae]|uniref:hypothetical protein n=1 Tax=Burkholderia glumae TaxID=337 RepID=UPI002150C1E3|nr:hypothetical protein [Burkholderia glumae]